MPWCEPCSRYFPPSALTEEGRCPSCGDSPVATTLGGRIDHKTLDLKKLAEDDEKVPWHFKLLVTMLIAYLGWRIVDLVS